MELELSQIEASPHLSLTAKRVRVRRHYSQRIGSLSFPQLEHLAYVGHGCNISKKDLRSLKLFPKLNALDLVTVDLTPKDLRFIASLPLKSLGLCCPLPKVPLTPLFSLSLTALHFTIYDSDVQAWTEALPLFTSLRCLHIDDNGRNLRSNFILPSLPLTKLRLDTEGPYFDLTSVLSSLRSLTVFNLEFTGSSQLPACTNLTKLKIQDRIEGEVSLLPSSLTSLSIGRIRFDFLLMPSLSRMTGLRSLSFSHIGRVEIKSLAICASSLTSLHISGMFDTDIRPLQSLTALVSLGLKYDNLKSYQLVFLNALQDLHTLDLRGNHLSAKCLPGLAQHPSLTSLSLEANNITSYQALESNTLITSTQDKIVPEYILRNRRIQRSMQQQHAQYFWILLGLRLKTMMQHRTIR